MNNKERKYTVLMSVYYKENPEWFDNSIESMINQTIFPDEFVLVEDGKLTQELDLVVDKYVKKYPKLFKVIHLDENVGLGKSLAIGIDNCKNEFIARMDSDDYSDPSRIEKQFKIFEEDNTYDMVGSNVDEFQYNIDNIISKCILPENHNDIYEFSKKRNPFRHPALLYRKSAVKKAGNYRHYPYCEDYDLFIRMISSGSKCYNIQETLTYMRVNDDFYKRRGGIRYLGHIMKFKNEQLKTGYYSLNDYIKTSIPHIIVSLLPNNLRDYIYVNLLRNKPKGNEVTV